MVRIEFNKIKGVLGLFLLMWLIIKNKSTYKGRNAFYRLVQDERDSLKKNLAIAFLDNTVLNSLFSDYQFLRNNLNRENMSSAVIEQYQSDDYLKGFGDWEYKKGGASLQEQQRGLILPLLKDCLLNIQGKIVAEIGTGNGDVLAYLAKEYPRNNYIGIDFSVKVATQKHNAENVKFIKGYALEVFEGGGP